MEFLHDHGPFEGEKLQFMGRVDEIQPLSQLLLAWVATTAVHTIITSLVEDSPQTRPASIMVWSLKGLVKSA